MAYCGARRGSRTLCTQRVGEGRTRYISHLTIYAFLCSGHVSDPHLMAITSSLLTRLASVPTPGVYNAVVRQALPPLCVALASSGGEGQDKWIAGAALEQLCGLLQGAPAEGGVGDGFVAQLGPVLFGKIKDIADRDAIQVWGISWQMFCAPSNTEIVCDYGLDASRQKRHGADPGVAGRRWQDRLGPHSRAHRVAAAVVGRVWQPVHWRSDYSLDQEGGRGHRANPARATRCYG